MRALDPAKRLDSVDLPITCAAVESIGAQDLPHEFLEDIEVFVRAAGRNETTEGVGTMGLLEANRLLRHVFQRVFPGRGDEGAVAPDQGVGQAVGVTRGVEAEESAGAEIAVVPTGSVRGIDLDQLIVLGLDRDPAAVAAEGIAVVSPTSLDRVCVGGGKSECRERLAFDLGRLLASALPSRISIEFSSLPEAELPRPCQPAG